MLLSSGNNFPHLIQKRRSQLGFVTYLLNYPRRFRRVEQGLREALRVTRKEPVNSGRPRTVQTPADKDATCCVSKNAAAKQPSVRSFPFKTKRFIPTVKKPMRFQPLVRAGTHSCVTTAGDTLPSRHVSPCDVTRAVGMWEAIYH